MIELKRILRGILFLLTFPIWFPAIVALNTFNILTDYKYES